MNDKKLSGKDLMNVGVYSAIYFVIIFAIAMLGYIPIFMPLICVIGPLICGVPFMMFLTKVKKFGMILIMSFIMGLLMLLTGMGYYSIIVGVISGLLAEAIYKNGGYESASKAVLTHGVFSIWMWGNFIPLFTNMDKYFSTRQDYGQEYIQVLTSLMPLWMCPVLFISCFVCGIIGGFIGRSVLKKHFRKAGIV